MASPPGKRALALAQVGQGMRARRELRPLALSTEPQHLRTMAALAVGKQGKFWEFADKIFEETNGNDSLNLDKLPDYAREVGLSL